VPPPFLVHPDRELPRTSLSPPAYPSVTPENLIPTPVKLLFRALCRPPPPFPWISLVPTFHIEGFFGISSLSPSTFAFPGPEAQLRSPPPLPDEGRPHCASFLLSSQFPERFNVHWSASLSLSARLLAVLLSRSDSFVCIPLPYSCWDPQSRFPDTLCLLCALPFFSGRGLSISFSRSLVIPFNRCFCPLSRPFLSFPIFWRSLSVFFWAFFLGPCDGPR